MPDTPQSPASEPDDTTIWATDPAAPVTDPLTGSVTDPGPRPTITFPPADPAADPSADPSAGQGPGARPGGRPAPRMRTMVFGLILLVVAGAVLVGQLSSVNVDPGVVALALMAGAGLLLIAGAGSRRTHD